ncbi:MAG: PQQ-binding-like beta-propeller repeat protein [Gemmatimonadota bacterium]|nr:PQQ-binding-like beta-propeller repeat protein [Gemmatimonadota bacterium]
MNKRAYRALSVLLSLSLATAAFADEVDWPYYGADQGGTRYTPADQINRDNFDQLRVIWRYRPRDQQIYETARANRSRDRDRGRGRGDRRRGGLRFSNNRGTPLAVNGVLYYGSPYNVLSAVDGQSGEELWAFDPESWKAPSTFLGNSRGVSYWTDGEVERVFLATSTAHLYSIDAKTGIPDPNFGEGGRVDLGALLRRPLSEEERRSYGVTAPPVVCRDVVAVGSAIVDALFRPPPEYMPPGDVQAFDVRTGEKVWEFHTIPQEGEYGNETWESDAWKTYGAANVWATMTADEELGYLYLPVSTASHDYYGGERPGDNLFSESVVCLKAETGERVWHYQLVHHGLWDYDPAAVPLLLDVVVDGQKRKVVAQLTKQAFCFVFDRVTGEPIWPIEEKPVPQSQVAWEKTSPTQPFPTKPAPFERQGISEDDLIDFTPELREEAKAILAEYDYGPLYTPPTEKGVLSVPGQAGGADWAGGAADPRTGVLYVPSHMAITNVELRPVRDLEAYSAFSARAGRHIRGPRGLPLVKPPYGSITAIDLNSGEHLWRTAVGKGPVDHPALKGIDLPDMGWDNRTFVLATPNLLLATSEDPHGLADAGRDYFVDRDACLRAYDLASGEEIGRVELPSNAYGAPMSYMAGGRQYVVVPLGNRLGRSGRPPELVALAIPHAGEELPPQGRDRGDADHKAFYKAVEAMDAGDSKTLQKLLTEYPELATARGYLDEYYEYPYFRGATLLHHLAGEPQRVPLPENAVELAAALISAGADPNAATHDSISMLDMFIESDPLEWAESKPEMIQLLVTNGVDVNRNRGQILWNALRERDIELASMLVAEGADVDLRFAAGVNRVDLMAEFFDAEGQPKEGIGHLYHPDPDTVLTAEQIMVEALNFAAYSGALEAAEFLLDRGVDINGLASGFTRYDRGSTPLHKTVMADQLEMARLLLVRGADPLARARRFRITPYELSNYLNTSEALDELLREYSEAAAGPADADSSTAPPRMCRGNRGGSR